MVQFWVCENIPFNKNYKDVVSFDTQDLQQSYFKNLSRYTDISNRFRITGTDISFRLAQNYDNSNKINYMVILQDGKHYYFFIDSVQYVDANTTQLNGTMDIWQTYLFEHEIRDAFISRQHEDRFYGAVDNKIYPIYNLEEENINLGNTYEVISTTYKKDPNDIDSLGLEWYYIVTSDPLEDVQGDELNSLFKKENKSLGFYLYTLPIHKQSNTIFVQYAVGFQELVKPDSREFLELVKNPKVISIYFSNYAPAKYRLNKPSTSTETTIEFVDNRSIRSAVFSNRNAYINVVNSLDRVTTFDFETLQNPIYFKTIINKDNPRNIKLEPKLYTKPYTVFSFTNMSSEPLELGRNEWDKNITYIESFGPQYKVLIGSDKYDSTKYFDSIISTKNNELPLLNDKYLNYILNNKASAITGIAIPLTETVAGASLSIGGLMGSQNFAKYYGLNTSIQGARKVTDELANRYNLKNAPVSLREVGNNLVFQNEMDNNSFYLNAVTRRVKEQFFNRAYDYLYRYGYKVNKFGIPNKRSRYYFNYIECSEVTVTGNINQSILTELENIYKNGTTIWHKRGNEDLKIYDYTKENVEVSLI